MATSVMDLLNDVFVSQANEKESERQRKEAEARLIAGLTENEAPLPVNGAVVIGKWHVKRGQHDFQSLVITEIANVNPDAVVSK